MVRNLKELFDAGYIEYYFNPENEQFINIHVGDYKNSIKVESDTRLDKIVEMVNDLINAREGK